MESGSLKFMVLFCVLAFVFGFVAAQVLSYFSVSVGLSPSVALSPADRISGRDILVYSDRVEVPVSGARVVSYADTESMAPFLDGRASGIVVDVDCSGIVVGDVISYHSGGNVLVHRVVRVSSSGGFLVKGDNSENVDEVLCSELEGVLVGVVY